MTTGMKVSRQDLVARIISKALEDVEFRELLLSDPRATIEEELGSELPAEMEIEVLQETPAKIYLVLPALTDGMELADDQLDRVAGGMVAQSHQAGHGLGDQLARPARPARPASPVGWDPGERGF